MSIKMLGALCATTALLLGAGTQLAAASSDGGCAALDDVVLQAEAADGSALFTPWASEITGAAQQGFTSTGPAFLASTIAEPGLVGVHRLYQSTTRDFLYTTSAAEVASAKARYGYVDQGVRFYVAPKQLGCTVTVPRLVKGDKHRLAPLAAEASSLSASGWRVEGAKFHVGALGPVKPPPPPPSPPGKFTFAVIPDAQHEVLKAGDPRLRMRSQWLADRKVAFVTQTGDLMNWDTPEHEQYQRAKSGFDVLTRNGVPYTVAVGNHDTAATAPGGSARPGKTWELVRDTRTLNNHFASSDFGAVSGAFEPGKVDNVYSTYQAGGKKWMVLTLEFCARKSVVEWARKVVAANPDVNVIISTHSYLTSSGGISTSNSGYGDSSPQYVYDRLVSQYPNVKMVFSGHVGGARKARVDRGVNGNKIYSFLTTMHERDTNPVRMVTVDTSKDTISSTIYAPLDNRTWSGLNETVTGVGLR